MDANHFPSNYEEALQYICELEHNIENLNAIIETDDKLITKYEELVAIYKKELGE